MNAPNNWKRTYWPEPILGTSRLSRREAIENVRGEKPKTPRITLSDALAKLAEMGR